MVHALASGLLLSNIARKIRSARDDFSYRTPMRRIVRRAFVVMENFPTLEIARELARSQAMLCRRFPRLGDVHDREQVATRYHSSLCRFKEAPLQIIADNDEVPSRTLNHVFALFKVCSPRIQYDATFGSATAQDVDRSRRTVDGCDAPTMFGKPERISAGATGKIKCRTRRCAL